MAEAKYTCEQCVSGVTIKSEENVNNKTPPQYLDKINNNCYVDWQRKLYYVGEDVKVFDLVLKYSDKK